MKITSEIIELLSNKYNQIEYCSNYGEKGYTKDEGKTAILFSNWNDYPKHVLNALEKQFMLEWSDEWIISYETDKCYRTSGDCYSWKPYYTILNECEVVGGDEIESDSDIAEKYISEELVDNPNKVNLFRLNLEQFRFERINETEYENGWYGSNDTPTKILKELQHKYPNKEFIFSDLSNEQFRSNFNVYGRDKE